VFLNYLLRALDTEAERETDAVYFLGYCLQQPQAGVLFLSSG
jgi:hypothetical protein